MTPEDLVELEAIKRLKYAYARCLDLKLWDEIAGVFTEDAVAAYSGGGYTFEGRDAIVDFLRRKWARELSYRLRKELWCFTDNRISVRFEYESHDPSGQWWRSHGNEHWEFDENGLMRRRDASINDYEITPDERRLATDKP